MSRVDDILRAYHRKVALHRQKTGVSYPLTRASCVDEDRGEIFDTDVNDPQLVATFNRDAQERIRITLV